MSGPPASLTRSQDRRELGAVGQAGLVAERRGRRRTAGVAHLERLGEVRAVEPGGDEPGTERVAGTDRVDDHGERDAGSGDREFRLLAIERERPVRAELDDRDRRPEVQRGAGESGRVLVVAETGDDGQLVRAAEEDVDATGERAQDRARPPRPTTGAGAG